MSVSWFLLLGLMAMLVLAGLVFGRVFRAHPPRQDPAERWLRGGAGDRPGRDGPNGASLDDSDGDGDGDADGDGD